MLPSSRMRFLNKELELVENRSHYDPSRKTVGAIYRDAQMASHDPYVVNGDLTNELMKSLVVDLNATISSDPYQGKPFYITVHEKKDLLMKRCIKRRMVTTKYRPYPENDTCVFHVKDIPSNDVRFCWSLPHHTEMYNMLANSTLFDPELIENIKAWRRMDLQHFGFVKNSDGSGWIPNPHFEDTRLGEHKNRSCVILF